MLIYINGQLVEIDDDRAQNREIIRQKGEELRIRIWEARSHGRFIDSDKEVLALLLKIIAHDRVYSTHESLQDRGKSLYNIARTVVSLSDRAKQEDEPKQFKEKYFDPTERSIWRDIEFLHKLCIPPDQLMGHDNHFLPDSRLKRILEKDLPVLADIISIELNDSIPEHTKQAVRDTYKDTKQLPNIYKIVNYYREQESFEKVLRETDPTLLTQIDPKSIEGKLAILRVLEVIGENLTQKNITPTTRNTDAYIDLNLLVGVRNRLAHHEWYLGHDGVIQKLLGTDLDKIFEVEIPFIRGRVEALWKNHQAVSELHAQNARAYDRAISDYFVEPYHIAQIPEGTKNAIQQYSKWLLDNEFIDEKSYYAILGVLDKDIREVDISEMIMVIIGKDKFSKEYIQSLQSSSIVQLNSVIAMFNQINGELSVDIERVKELINKFVLLCGLKAEELQSLKKEIEESITLEQLVSCIPDVQPVAKGVLRALKLREKINAVKKNNDEIRDLYKDLCDQGYVQEQVIDSNSTEINDIVADLKAKKITKDVGSKAINTIKLAAIDTVLRLNPEFQDIDKHKMDVSEAYYRLRKDIKVDFVITEGLKKYIIEFCEHLKKIGWLSEANEEQITKILEDVHAQPHLIFTLKHMIGEEKFLPEYREKLKTTQLILLEQMTRSFGDIPRLIAEDHKEFCNAMKANEDGRNQDALQYLGDLRILRDLLPDDVEYKLLTKDKKLVEQKKVISEALNAIDLLEQIFAKLNSHAFNALQKSYPEERQFLMVPAQYSQYLEKIDDGSSGYKAAIDRLKEDFRGSNDCVPIPLNFRAIINEDDIIRGSKVPISMSKEEVEDYIQRNQDFIIEETIHYAHFLDLGYALKQNPVLLKAAEYVVSIIFPYLANLQIEYLGNIPDMLQRELKAQRNVIKHGNIYVDLLASDNQEQYLVRYASIFIVDLKQQISKLHYSFVNQKFDIYKNDHDSWYTGDNIRDLLHYYLDEEYYTVLAPTVFDNSDLLHANTVAAVNTAVAGQTVVMPINLHENHWVGAIVRMQADGQIQVIFNNTLGHNIELEPNAVAFVQNIQSAIAQNNGSAPNIIDLHFHQQQNGDDCGAFTVDNLVRLATTQNLDNLSREEIMETADLQQTKNGNAYLIRANHNIILVDLLRLEAIPMPNYYEELNNSNNDATTGFRIDNFDFDFSNDPNIHSALLGLYILAVETGSIKD